MAGIFKPPGLWCSPETFDDMIWPPPGVGYCRPRDLPDLRRRMAGWLHPTKGDAFNFHYHQSWDNAVAQTGGLVTRETYPSFVRQLVEMEHRNVSKATIYWVTAEMTRQVRAAATSMPLFRPRPEDFPAPYGMMVFETPIGGYTRHNQSGTLINHDTGEVLSRHDDEEAVPIVMITWGVIAPHENGIADDWHDGGMWLSIYRWREESLQAQTSYIAPHVLADMRSKFPPFIPDNEYGMAFDMSQRWDEQEAAQSIAEADDPNATAWYAKYLLAAALMMQRPVFIQRREQVVTDKVARKKLARAGLTDYTVTLIDARPHRYADAGDGEHVVDRVTGRKHTKRSYVSPHWRRQWYPSEERHKPKWIEEHWRGPVDGELSNVDKMTDAVAGQAAERVRVLKS